MHDCDVVLANVGILLDLLHTVRAKRLFLLDVLFIDIVVNFRSFFVSLIDRLLFML